MTLPIEAIAFHGWGYDRTCWLEWQSAFANHNISLTTFDRGYFGNPFLPSSSNSPYRILLVHSYGLHLCPVEQLQSVNTLIIFSSFLTFHPDEERLKRRSQRVLQRMIDEFETQPMDVLKAFRMNSDDLSTALSNSLNHSLLLHDLKHLGIVHIDPNVLQSIPQIIIFHGTGDRIVPMMQSQRLSELLESKARYFEIPDAGHALPFTHQIDCWDILKNDLPVLRSGG